MITIHINKDYMNDLYFDGLQIGKSQFASHNGQYVAHVTLEEYDSFLKDNNLISYKNHLKYYENGEEIGTFETIDD